MRREAVAKLTNDVLEKSADTPVPGTTNTIPLQDSDDRQEERMANNAKDTVDPCESRLA